MRGEPAVLKAAVPPHDVGQIELHLTMGDGRPLSNPMPFRYRATSSDAGLARRVMVGESDQVLQQHLIAMLQGHHHGHNQGHKTSHVVSDQDSGKSCGTSHHRHSSHPGYQGMPLESTTPFGLLPTSFGQGERLLQGLIEGKVKQHLQEGMWGSCIEELGGAAKRQKVLCALDDTGVAGIHLVAGLGYSLALDALLTHGADPSTKDAHGYTALHWAAARRKLGAVALLVARRADVEALTFQCKGHSPGAQAPADLAALGGCAGIAVFLGELQLQQAAHNLRDAGQEGPDDTAFPGITMHRKRSRLLSLADAKEMVSCSPSPGHAYNWAGTWQGKENVDSVAIIVSTAKRHAQLLEDALLRKYARRCARQEKKEQAQKREMEALGRIHEMREQWRLLLQQIPDDRREAMLDRCIGIGQAIVDIQHTLETVIQTRPLSTGGGREVLEAGEYLQVKSDGYGSDSDLSMSRRGSLLGQRKAQHLHDYRGALGAVASIPKTSDTDLRRLLSSGGSLTESPALDSRSRSRSTISRALAHVQQLETRNPEIVAQYASVKQSAQDWLGRMQQGFKSARVDLRGS